MPEVNMLPSQWTRKTRESEDDERIVLRHDDPEIIDLTIDEPVPSSSSVNTPEKTPKKRQRDPDVVEVDSL